MAYLKVVSYVRSASELALELESPSRSRTSSRTCGSAPASLVEILSDMAKDGVTKRPWQQVGERQSCSTIRIDRDDYLFQSCLSVEQIARYKKLRGIPRKLIAPGVAMDPDTFARLQSLADGPISASLQSLVESLVLGGGWTLCESLKSRYGKVANHRVVWRLFGRHFAFPRNSPSLEVVLGFEFMHVRSRGSAPK